ncbi:MAG: carboxypeptidase regulatory-like domain-containing protein [Abditibacteriales bacterium]|nr:carboxypeptidase regulatory-like domain-containing protein [Abditibacteriales bacterium]MDW8367435.1 carboxypeptidase regulatory-like domain-containing protein [Abditibacteriales bacterium]
MKVLRIVAPVCVAMFLALMVQGVEAKGRGGSKPPEPSRVRKPGFIVGVVTNTATGSPIKGALVSALPLNGPIIPLASSEDVAEPIRAIYPPPYGYTTRTNARGRFSLVVPAGEYEVIVSAQGYMEESSQVTVSPRRTVRINFALAESGFGTVTGTVWGVAPDGSKKPLACADVLLYSPDAIYIMAAEKSNAAMPAIYPPPYPQVKTDENGKFRFEDVPTGTALLNAWRLGYGYAHQEITVTKDRTTDVTLELPLQSATVKGKVTDTATGQPIVGAVVVVRTIYDRIPEILVGAMALRQAAHDSCPPPEVELIGVSDEDGDYELMLPLYDVVAYEAAMRAGSPTDPRILPPLLLRHELIAFKRGYEVATQTIENPQVGATVTVNFQLTRRQ